jgi:hypothetical protein
MDKCPQRWRTTTPKAFILPRPTGFPPLHTPLFPWFSNQTQKFAMCRLVVGADICIYTGMGVWAMCTKKGPSQMLHTRLGCSRRRASPSTQGGRLDPTRERPSRTAAAPIACVVWGGVRMRVRGLCVCV